MNTIDFVVRGSAGGIERGTVAADATNQVIVAGSGQEISINARQSDFASQIRTGDSLVITLSDGRMITIDNFFNDSGTANRLFLSADGYLNEVSFAEIGEGNLYAQYGPTAEWGKWSPSDELIFLGNSEIAAAPLADGEEVSMLGAGLLGAGGFGGIGAGIAATGAGLAVAGAAGGGGGGSASTIGTADPYVDDSESNVTISDDDDETLVITGGGEPGDNVTVTVGDKSVDTVIDEDGKFEAVFEGDNFPEDGVYDAEVVVTDPSGEETELEGPSFEIDTIAPEITFTQGTESVGDYFNGESFADGITISGEGEAGATLVVTINEVSRTTTVSEDGTWTATWEAGTFEPGEYTTGITAVATDSFGNSKSFSDTLVVDTVTTVTVTTTSIGEDGTINGVEHADGVDFTGRAEAGASVEVTIGEVTQTVTATSSGRWTATFSSEQLAQGEYTGTISVVSTDTFGNVGTASGSFEVDTLVRDFAITSSTGGADSVITPSEIDDPLVVSGTTEPGSTVSVTLGDATVQAVVAEDGSWTATFASGSVEAGSYTATMTATATDLAGNVDTATTSVQVDTEAGLLTIDTTPVEGDDIVNKDEASDGVVITGTSDPNALVTVTLAGASRDVRADSDGNWEAPFAAGEVEAGVYTAQITAVTTDEYGNTATAEDSVLVDTRVDNLSIDGDSVAGDNIISAAEYGGTVTVTGTTEAGSQSVMVTMGGVTVAATGASSGSWSAVFDADVLPRGTDTHDIDVLATDRAGNVKSASATVQVDTEVTPFNMTTDPGGADDVVSLDEAAGGIVLGGAVEAGSKVTVTFDGTEYEADVNDNAGTWSLTVPAGDIREGKYPAQITVEAEDHVGNRAEFDDVLQIDTDAPDGPIVNLVLDGRDGFEGIRVETAMEGGVNAGETISVQEVAANGQVSDVDGTATPLSSNTLFEFDNEVPDGSDLIVNATDTAGNTSGTYLALDGEDGNSAIDLTNVALGEFQIETLDLDWAEAASVTIDEASLLALSTNSNTLTIRGSSEDELVIEGGAADGTRTVDGETFNVYNVGSEGTLLVDMDIPDDNITLTI